MVTLILFRARVAHPLTDELILAGHRVFEALAISEVFALAEEHPEAQIIIGAEIELERARVIQKHYPTIQLKPNAVLVDILWDLGLLLPTDSKSLQ